jgi:alkaline phosphatase D
MKKISLVLTVALSACFTFSLFTSCQHTSTDSNHNKDIIVKKSRYEKPINQNGQFNVPYRSLNTSKVITRFGFGSCNDQTQDQPLWKKISAKNLDLFIMMGDNIYASRPEHKPIFDQYVRLNRNKDYAELREKVPFLATWDDHDYGQNDGGFDNPEKKEALRVFRNYWSYTKNIIPADQDGVYHSRIIGEKKQRVQVILLDTRSSRSELLPSTEAEQKMQPPRLYVQNTQPEARILSDAQWSWLKAELQKPAELRLIVSSIQFIPTDHGFEKWNNFPAEREKMIQLLEKNKIKNVIFLSGDRHLSSLAKMKTKQGDIFEMTASGLNRPSRATEPELDQFYVVPTFLKINFGLAEINWPAKQITLSIVDENDQQPITQTIKF